ncbi:aldose epimerase family protein [Bacteroidota bacterium]
MKSTFGKTHEGIDVFKYDLATKGGLKVSVINYGATVISLEIPDKNGNLVDVVLGFDNIDQYLGDHPYFGATIGRYCNRIANGKFEIDGQTFNLTKNNNGNNLHGGEEKAFHRVVWDIQEFENEEGVGLNMKHLSKDNDEGFPGNLQVKVTYFFTHNNEFKISYSAETDKSTHVNLTHHSYFNFTGCKENIFNHEVMINSKKITEVNDNLIPTGEFKDVKASVFDFITFKKLGDKLSEIGGTGFDNNYVLDKHNSDLALAAKVKEQNSGIALEIYTNEPGIQFYTGYFIDKMKAKNNIVYDKFYGLALEPQHFPNSPNTIHFPSTLLKPGEEYKSQTIYRFLIE